MNQKLNVPFTREEVEIAMRQMAPLKALGQDGFGACVFHKHWKVVGNDVYATVLHILYGNSMTSLLNQTFIPLIPIVKNPDFVDKFRPISLCNILYKLVFKTIVNHLKPLMSSLISCNQSTFLSGV